MQLRALGDSINSNGIAVIIRRRFCPQLAKWNRCGRIFRGGDCSRQGERPDKNQSKPGRKMCEATGVIHSFWETASKRSGEEGRDVLAHGLCHGAVVVAVLQLL